MSKASRLTLQEIRKVMRLASDARELRHTRELQQHALLTGFTNLVGADRGYTNTLADFVPGGVIRPVQLFIGEKIDTQLISYLTQTDKDVTHWDDPFVDRGCRWRGQTQVASCELVLPDDDWRKYPIFEGWRSGHAVSDILANWFRRRQPRDICGLVAHRMGKATKFNKRERSLAKLLIDELHYLYQRGQLEPPQSPLDSLSRRQREVLKYLLGGKSAKRIAFELGLSIFTIREYLQTIYRKFEVTGRDELMSRFIRQR